MAIKDSATTVIKAADAKRAMLEGPKVSLQYVVDLVQKHNLYALAAFNVNAGEPVQHTVATFNQPREGLEVIENWAKNTAQRFGTYKDHKGAILLAIRSDGIIDVATWGKTTADCDALGTYGGAILRGLPGCPFQTWFGWGNAGVPKKLKPAAIATLNDNQRAYVARNTHPDAGE